MCRASVLKTMREMEKVERNSRSSGVELAEAWIGDGSGSLGDRAGALS